MACRRPVVLEISSSVRRSGSPPVPGSSSSLLPRRLRGGAVALGPFLVQDGLDLARGHLAPPRLLDRAPEPAAHILPARLEATARRPRRHLQARPPDRL